MKITGTHIGGRALYKNALTAIAWILASVFIVQCAVAGVRSLATSGYYAFRIVNRSSRDLHCVFTNISDFSVRKPQVRLYLPRENAATVFLDYEDGANSEVDQQFFCLFAYERDPATDESIVLRLFSSEDVVIDETDGGLKRTVGRRMIEQWMKLRTLTIEQQDFKLRTQIRNEITESTDR